MSHPYPFPEIVDNTALSGFATCPKYFEWQQVRRIIPIGESIHLLAGAALARGLERTRKAYFEQGLDAQTALRHGMRALVAEYGNPAVEPDHPKSLFNMMRALIEYFDQWPLATDPLKPHRFQDGRYGIEFTFCLPMEVPHPVTGNPILFAGRFDEVGNLDGSIYNVDEKTAGRRSSTHWDLRSQFMGYAWACRQHGINVSGTIVREILLYKDRTEFDQHIILHPPWAIERWWIQANRYLYRAVEAWRENYFDYDLSTACNNYGGCTYAKLCKVQDPEPWIAMDYRANEWNPLVQIKETAGA